MSDAVSDAINRNDLDELLRLVDAFTDTREWDELVDLKQRARDAFERGRQLWPAASRAEYRLALDAPAPYAAAVLTDDAGRFAFGPLSEVAASTHTWAELAPHAPPTPAAALAAHERVLRGEQIDPNSVVHAEVLSLPLHLERWEPEYLLATYRPDRVDVDDPEPVRGRPLPLPTRSARRVDDLDVTHALRDLVSSWTARSEGTARVVCVEGTAEDAIAALASATTAVRGAEIDGGDALARLAWAGASGARHGRRRGAATGRDLAWAAAGALAGFPSGERAEPGALGDAISELRWLVWSAPDVSTGWVLRLAIEDAVDGVAWGCDAVDPA